MKKICLLRPLPLLALTGPAGARYFPTGRDDGHSVRRRRPDRRDRPRHRAAHGRILGQTVIVENVGGAGGMTGAKRVADAAPDGYTMMLGTVGTQAQSQTLYKRPLYNVGDRFHAGGADRGRPIALLVRKDLPANNLKEFVAYAKANQDKMQFGSAGAGSATHLGCVVLNTAMGTNITHVPYKGTGPAMQDLVGRPHRLPVRDHLHRQAADRRRQVARSPIMTTERSPVLPNLPTTGSRVSTCRPIPGTRCICRRARRPTSSRSSTTPRSRR